MGIRERQWGTAAGWGGKPFPILSFPGVQLTGATVGEVVGNAAQQARCMKAVAEAFESEAIVSPMDLSVEAEAFGSAIRFSEGEVPTVAKAIIQTDEDAERLTVPAVGSGRTDVYIEAIRLVKGMVTDRPVFAGAIGPFSLAARLMDMTEIMVKCLLEPEQTHLVLEKATAFLCRYVRALKQAGADGVVLAEPAAGLLSPSACGVFSCRYVRTLVEAVQDASFRVIYHNCGNTLPLLSTLLQTGAAAYHFGDAVDIGAVLEILPAEVPVLGNLSPSGVFRYGTPQSVASATRAMLEKGCGHANYIPSSGCDIPPQTPLENIRAFFDAVRAFGEG